MVDEKPPDVVRADADRAEIVGHYCREDEEYILKRLIGAQGRSRAFVNEQPVTHCSQGMPLPSGPFSTYSGLMPGK